MKYEVYFLNNMLDAMEEVNVNLQAFLDLCYGEKYYDMLGIKHIIVNLSNSFELLLKYRLLVEHWAFVFADVNKAKVGDFETGNFTSVDTKNALNRVHNICEVEQKFSACLSINRYRNQLMHYTLKDIFEKIVEDIVGAMKEIILFVEQEICEHLPEGALEEILKIIQEYKEHIEGLEKLDFTL